MNESDQEALFKRVQKRFRAWSERKCSGYVHGVVDEPLLIEPHPLLVLDLESNEYNLGYLYGFIDTRGPDVFSENWYKLSPKIIKIVSPSKTVRLRDYQWWVKK